MSHLRFKTFSTVIGAAVLFGLLFVIAAPQAIAQTPPLEKKVEDISKQIQTLKQAMDDLQQAMKSAEEKKPADEKKSKPEEEKPAEKSDDPLARIRDEGMNRSQVMQTLSYICDVIGPRLTGSPALERANKWTADKLSSWGLVNAHQEQWGPIARGWTLKRFYAQVVEPQSIPLDAYPKAWTPGLEKPIEAELVYFDVKTEEDLEKYQGKLKGAAILISPPRDVKPHFEPQATRRNDSELLKMSNAGEQRPGRGFGGGGGGRRGGQQRPREISLDKKLAFLLKEQAAIVLNPSNEGDGGLLFVGSAAMPAASEARSDTSRSGGGFGMFRSSWNADASATLPQIVVGVENYNRLVRMIQQGEKLKLAAELQVEFSNKEAMSYNTIAEIPGTDLKDEIVMLGGHLDSWHSGTGATDDGTGVAASMEAVRILKALNIQPRRTIRIAFWSGEELGMQGSRAYCNQHFVDSSKSDNSGGPGGPGGRQIVHTPEWDKVSVYFNFDEGTGKIRGMYLEGNDAVRPLFRRWFEPFREWGAETLTLNRAGGTDHDSFNAVGIPGFHFLQDMIDYETRTHHSNADVYDRVQPEDLKQASVIIATFVYNAAMMDEKIPRKPAK